MASGSRRWEEQPGDRQLLAWLARFRFAAAAQVSIRTGVSERRARSRLARLAECGLVICVQPHRSAIKRYALNKRGFEMIGELRRRVPRWDVQVDHELAIVLLVARLEIRRPDLQVLTERDCRRAEAESAATYSVLCQQRSGAMRRWPDIVIDGDGRCDAIEIELAPKTTERLRGILLGYLTSGTYCRVHIRCGSPTLERRVRRTVEQLGGTQTIEVAPA